MRERSIQRQQEVVELRDQAVRYIVIKNRWAVIVTEFESEEGTEREIASGHKVTLEFARSQFEMAKIKAEEYKEKIRLLIEELANPPSP